MTKTRQIEAIAEPVLARHGCDLVLLTYRRERRGWVLRLLIERHGADPDAGSGVDLGLCAKVSRDLGAVLDAEDALREKHTLEVSSAGLDRPLVRPADFERFAGREISLKASRPIDGRRRFKGLLQGRRDGRVLIRMRDGETVGIPDGEVTNAKLVFEPARLGAKTGDV
ncbi:MAG: ribosome maturation factor RimP [Deltaproteobacteria bacterium]|jgi:ribosome maturation factor RimP|nr:ribosome maturation factor RimP [Deltaproteobacteria bacterium]